MNACTVIGEAPPPRDNPFDGLSGYRRRRFGSDFFAARHAWAVEHSGYCQSSRPPVGADCIDVPRHAPEADPGDLVEAEQLIGIRDGLVGRVVYVGEIDGYPEVVVAWTDGRSTSHAAPLHLPRATAAPDRWAAASLASVGDRRWALNPKRRLRLEPAHV